MSIKKEKTWNLIGMALGAIIVIVGIIVWATPAKHYSTSGYLSDTSFGADFYTYEYKATRIAADNAAVAANNLRELGGKLACYYGLAFVFGGIVISFVNARKYFVAGTEAAPAAVPAAEPAAAATTVADENKTNIETEAGKIADYATEAATVQATEIANAGQAAAETVQEAVAEE